LILVLTDPLGGGLAHCGLVTKLSTARPPGLDCLQLLLADGRFFGLVPVGGGGAYQERRRRRGAWIQDQSLSGARAWSMPPAVRDDVLRQHGDQMLRERY
jgi:hypothetical protein